MGDEMIFFKGVTGGLKVVDDFWDKFVEERREFRDDLVFALCLINFRRVN